MDISIVIVNWNTRDILKDCLQSVYEQTKQIKFEVIVVDNASSDGSCQMVKQDFPQVTLIENQVNVGFAAANNIGFKYAKGDFILLLNSDTVVLDSAIDKTFQFAKNHEDYGVVSCKMVYPDLSLQPNCSMYPSIGNHLLFVTGLYKLFPKSRFFGRQRMSWWDYDDVREVEVLQGCFMLVRKQALADVGPMDERYFMYSEEVDWCYRFKVAGWKLVFFPDAQVIHIGGASAARLGGDRARVKDKSTKRFYKKHYSRPAYFFAIFLMFVFYLTRLPGVWVFRMLKGSAENRKRLANHWKGLTGLFQF